MNTQNAPFIDGWSAQALVGTFVEIAFPSLHLGLHLLRSAPKASLAAGKDDTGPAASYAPKRCTGASVSNTTGENGLQTVKVTFLTFLAGPACSPGPADPPLRPSTLALATVAAVAGLFGTAAALAAGAALALGSGASLSLWQSGGVKGQQLGTIFARVLADPVRTALRGLKSVADS